MRERPIIMTAESVRAILAGQKSQTRRVVTPQPSAGVRWGTLGKGWEDGHGRPLRNPYGAPGDRLWVREGWRAEARELERGRLGHPVAPRQAGRQRDRLGLHRQIASDLRYVTYYAGTNGFSVAPIGATIISDQWRREEGVGVVFGVIPLRVSYYRSPP